MAGDVLWVCVAGVAAAETGSAESTVVPVGEVPHSDSVQARARIVLTLNMILDYSNSLVYNIEISLSRSI